MSSYEFWDELGKIFNAVVAYQEKNLEFNKRFISPWIRLGNVFEKQDRNKDAVNAYEKAIEIDGANPQNWFELGSLHFKMENYGEAISAFNRAIELDPSFGLAYSNLALTLVATGETEQAITLYQKAIDLLQEPKDKAVAWNRLGNAYRKLNQYEQALEAFHRADELDRENSGFRDSLDEVSAAPTLMQTDADGASATAEPVSVSPIELIVAESRADEAAASAAVTVNEATENAIPIESESAPVDAVAEPVVEAAPVAEPAATVEAAVEPPATEAPATAEVATDAPEATGSSEETPAAAEASAEESAGEAVAADEADSTVVGATPAAEAAPVAEETVTVVVQDSTETFTETLPVGETATETTDSNLSAEAKDEAPAEAAVLTTEVVTSEDAEAQPAPEVAAAVAEMQPEVAAEDINALKVEVDALAALDPAPNSLADQLLEAEPAVLDIPQHVAYEEYLKDMSEPLGGLDEEETDEPELPGSPEPVAKLDPSGELQIEMDTKNAHVWNELGNVYYNSSAFDDAIVAYSKAIELDRWFAWPYSNLALAYVQKRRFVEAILLYQRSIELFGSDKDKAISWNRLGNVYRRLNDYENAIAAYQRADALDPDNSTLSLQSRFSLLGNYAMEQKPSYVS